MSKLEFLIDQIIESRNFVNRLLSDLPQDLWYEIPEHTDSNFAWQLGHLMLSQNFHAITVISGKNAQVFKMIPPHILKEQFDAVHEICVDNLSKLPEDILEEGLEPIPIKHPVATTKYEALSWCFKHEMWQSAEMEDIKRALGHPIQWV
ncbi:MAG: DinB family protein [Bacteroidia bacterium]|nr:MAG: DinB family protein [Bacteroidia bacterium]